MNYGYISESAMLMSASIFEQSDVVVTVLVNRSPNLFRLSSFMCLLKKIQEALEKTKSSICFSSVTPEASSKFTSLLATMSSVPAERAAIYHLADEKFEFKLIDWRVSFVVYPLFTILKPAI